MGIIPKLTFSRLEHLCNLLIVKDKTVKSLVRTILINITEKDHLLGLISVAFLLT